MTENNDIKLKSRLLIVSVFITIALLLFSWGMTVNAMLTNVRLNEKAIERLDELKADKTLMNSRLDAIDVRMETLRETMNVCLQHIDEKLTNIQKILDKQNAVVIKEQL